VFVVCVQNEPTRGVRAFVDLVRMPNEDCARWRVRSPVRRRSHGTTMSDALRISVLYCGGELFSRTFAGKSILIGREADCELRLNHSDVSRHHACITRRGPWCYLLRDLESSNGTFVQGEAISVVPILEGGWVRIGVFDLTFRHVAVPWSEAEEPDTALARVWEQDTIEVG